MKSILQDERVCFMCGSYRMLEEHHVFGASNRKKSEQLGLKVYLCHFCHNEPPNGVHFNYINRLALNAKAQKKAMEYYNWSIEDFRREIGRSYL